MKIIKQTSPFNLDLLEILKRTICLAGIFFSSVTFMIAEEPLSFNQDIRPILSDKCFACHGPDGGEFGEKWKGGLRLDTRQGALADLLEIKAQTKLRKNKAEGKPSIQKKRKEKRYAVIPGKPEHSALVDRILSDDPNDIMPPPESKLTLSDREKKLLQRWIREGAKYDKHWAFIKPKKESLPKLNRLSGHASNEIDTFVLAKLEKEKIEPSPQANKRTWLRRVSLDLTGLPPKLKDIENFEKDISPQAWSKVVDRLLGSKDYAERMASLWMDHARYADSNGYQFDNERTMWPWRDWVIHAYMNNKSWDEFIVEQIAGDLLPNATYNQKIASGFNRNHGYSIEGGISNEEYRVMYANDKTTTFGTLFLGLTLECSRCHTHKYDPITIEDYYSLYAFFNQSNEKGAPGEKGRKQKSAAPFMKHTQSIFNGKVIKGKKNALAMVMTDLKKPRKTFVLNGGLFDQPGEEVMARVPLVLPAIKKDSPNNRLGLAKWLLSEDQPLFARVSVNRLWQQFFGRGLVESSDNFGAQGDRPSHPKLLDWLAVEFRTKGWDVKHIIRKIVLSSTYRQSSNARSELEDPKNKLLARGPSFRLSGETIRDQVLALSGLLVQKIGGPSVRPYQPKGIWEDLNAPRSHAEKYVVGKGDNLYRKSMYTYWRRAALHPFMQTFDAPSRDVCAVNREHTNTPLQALATMHAPIFIEASRVMAENISKEIPTDTQRIQIAFEKTLSRKPNSSETKLLQGLYQKRKEHYQNNPQAVKQLFSVGQSSQNHHGNGQEIAALADVCHTIFNLSESLTRK